MSPEPAARDHHERTFTIGDVAAIALLLVTMAALGALVALEWGWHGTH